MLWLIVTIFAYLFLAISFFGDKYILGESIPNPKVYSFFVGILSIFVIVFIPFGFFTPPLFQIFLAFLAGLLFLLALYLYYYLAKEFEISTIIPIIGGMVPIITFLFLYILSKGAITLSFRDIISFLLIVFGGILITTEKSKNIFGKQFIFSLGAAFYFALYFSLAKFVYDYLTFINGFIWIRFGVFLTALFFLIFKEVRSQISIKPKLGRLKASGIFIGNQIIGSLGAILQNWAISLAPLSYAAFVNALQGVQYIFLLMLTSFFSLKLPHILKENISRGVIFRKIIAILLIGGGLVLLAFK